MAMGKVMQEQESQHKYQQIRAELAEHIRSLAPGSRLTSERELARRFDCSFLTVRKALTLLVEEGVIFRRMGSGTYVAFTDGAPADQAVSVAAQPATSGRAIGVLIHSASDSYALQVLAALQQAARAESIRLCCRIVSEMDMNAREQVANLRAEGCIAVIVPWFPSGESSGAATLVRESCLPVCLPVLLPGLERSYFEVPELFGRNLISGIEDLGLYLRALGWQRIAFLGPDTPDSLILQKNLCGYGSFVCRNGLPSLIGLVQPAADSMDATAGLWKQYAQTLGVISYDDDHALRFLTAMHKFGLGAPADFGIVSFGNSGVALLTDPPLTCAYHDFDFPAGWMLQNALAMAQGQVAQATQEAGLHLVVRQSCGGVIRLGDRLEGAIREIGFDPVVAGRVPTKSQWA